MQPVNEKNLVKDKFYSILHRKDSTKDLGGFFVRRSPDLIFSNGGKYEFSIPKNSVKDYLFFEDLSARKLVGLLGINLTTYNNRYPARLNHAFSKTKNFRQKRRTTRKRKF